MTVPGRPAVTGERDVPGDGGRIRDGGDPPGARQRDADKRLDDVEAGSATEAPTVIERSPGRRCRGNRMPRAFRPRAIATRAQGRRSPTSRVRHDRDGHADHRARVSSQPSNVRRSGRPECESGRGEELPDAVHVHLSADGHVERDDHPATNRRCRRAVGEDEAPGGSRGPHRGRLQDEDVPTTEQPATDRGDQHHTGSAGSHAAAPRRLSDPG